MKNRLATYLTARSKNNAERTTANRHNLDTLHVLREEKVCLDALTEIVAQMPDEPALHATSERDEHDRLREAAAVDLNGHKRRLAAEKRAKSVV